MTTSKKICFDRILPRDLNRPQRVLIPAGGGPARAIVLFRKLWINGSNLRVRFMEGSERQKAITREQASW